MNSLGFLSAAVDVRMQGIELMFDSVKQQQMLSLNFVVQVSVPALLQELLNFQRSSGSLPLVPQAQATATLHATSSVKTPTVVPPKAQTPMLFPPAPAVPAALVASSKVAQATVAPAALEIIPSDSSIIQAVRSGSVTAVRKEIRHGINVQRSLAGGGNLLHTAIEAGGCLDMVSLLLQGKCNVNAPSRDSKTPLHLAVSQLSLESPSVARLLLCARANLCAPDSSQETPLQLVQLAAKQTNSMSPRSGAGLRQLLDEVSGGPTLAVVPIENEKVLGVCFADLSCDKVLFHTETSIGLYSMSQSRIVVKQQLSHLRVQAQVRSMAVSPVSGTVAVFLDIAKGAVEQGAIQNLVIVWPTGQLLDEEPLKLSIEASQPADHSMPASPPCLLCGSSSGPPTIMARISSGKVLVWKMNSSYAQIATETQLTTQGRLVAMSSDGRWMAVEEAKNGTHTIEVWSSDEHTGAEKSLLRTICSVQRRPESMAISGLSPASGQCCLALADEISFVDVLSIKVDGTISTAYRVRTQTPCKFLSFSRQSPELLMGGHSDGVVTVYNLPQGKHCRSHDDLDLCSAALAPNNRIIVTSAKNYFRVFKVAPDAI